MRAALAAALLLLPSAAAQAPPLQGGLVEVTWGWEPEELEVPQGAVVLLNATAQVRVSRAVCATSGDAHVELALKPSRPREPLEPGSGISVAPSPIAFNVTVPPGLHGAGAAMPFVEERSFAVQLLVSIITPPGEYEVLGATNTLPPRNCATTPSPDGDAEPTPASTGFRVRVRALSLQPAQHPEHEEHGTAGFDFLLDPGAGRAKAFNVTGVFPYHDHLHPELRGTIVVEPSGPDAADVVVTAQGFRPQEARVGKGGAVRWTNMDTQPHVVSADELHPQHAAGDEDAEFHEPAPAGASGPPRRVPGWEGALLAAGLGAALLRPRRR